LMADRSPMAPSSSALKAWMKWTASQSSNPAPRNSGHTTPTLYVSTRQMAGPGRGS
jgi:hypothetical protein